jgi:hypothetical protein
MPPLAWDRKKIGHLLPLLPDEVDDATDTESVMATLTRSPKGPPTVGSILLLMATCYAAYASPMPVPVLHRPEADDHFD